jgi:LysR family hydrogen peroxide-inducible transcriptional activator
MQIQKIEEELSIQILTEPKKPIQLTDIGQKSVKTLLSKLIAFKIL